MTSDLRFAARTLVKNPGFTGVAVLSLGLGIAATTTVFGLTNALLLQPLPVAEPGDLVRVGATRQNEGFFPFSYPEYRHLRDNTEVLSGLIGHQLVEVGFSAGGAPSLTYGELVTGNYFEVLGVEMALGRGFLPAEDRTTGTHPVVVVGHELWQRELGADPAVIGREVRLNGEPFVVVGVTGPEFTGTFPGMLRELWVPAMMVDVLMPGERALDRVDRPLLMLIGRLAPDGSPEGARVELAALELQLAAELPELEEASEKGLAVASAAGVHPFLAGGMTVFLSLLMGIVVVVLLIACANLAGLLLARGVGRQREIGIRLALGAGRLRVVRQLLVESVLLALLGGGAGLLVASWSMGLLMAFRPPTDVPLTVRLAVDWRVLLFSLGASFAAAALFGLTPALAASRSDLLGSLRREPGAGRPSRLRAALVVAQVGLSLVLLVGGGLLGRSLANSRRLQPGFEPQGVYMLRVGFETLGYDLDRAHRFYRELEDRVRALPGVGDFSVGGWIPLGDRGDARHFAIAGHEPPAGQAGFVIGYNLAGSGYFDTLRIPIRRGRAIDERDGSEAPPVVVVNETLAARFWPGEDAIGKRLGLAGEDLQREVVGVAADSKYRIISEAPQPYVYFPWSQFDRYDLTLQVRVDGDPAGVLAATRAVIAALDLELPVYDVRPVAEAIQFSMVPIRVAGSVLAVSGLVALLLAALGIYGVVSFFVLERNREIGVRVALGARPGDVLRLILGGSLRLTLLGVAFGTLASLAASRLIAGLLYDITPWDPLTLAGVATLLIAVAVAASWLPARRALAVDPAVTLRAE